MLYIIEVIINVFLSLLDYSVIIECVCSWIPEIQNTAFYSFIYRINSPFLNPIRRLTQKYFKNLPIDISPLVLIVIIGLIRRVL